MKSLDELRAMRERAQAMMELREGNADVRIVVGMGTCGMAAGAREALEAILAEIRARNLQHVTVTQTGCIGLCEQEPIVEVIRRGEPKVTYGRITPERARQIMANHIVNGRILGDLVILSQ